MTLRTLAGSWSEMKRSGEHLPGERAPAAGHYEELIVFSTLTGSTTHAKEG
jgi:hypothetical protein